MQKLILMALAAALTFAGPAFAEEKKSEGQTTIKIEDAAEKKNKVDGDIDEEITNRKLRAETGSKSKFSGSLTAIYNGASLEKPMDKNRPNPTNDPIVPKVTLGGDIGIRYRMDKAQSLKFGTGYSLQRPFHEAERGDISNPNIAYSYAGKIGGVQNVAEVTLTAATNSDDVEVGSLGSIERSDTMIYDFGGSRSSIGLAAQIIYTQYNKMNELVNVKGEPEAAPAKFFQEDWNLAAYPFYEYQFTDKVNFRTVFRPWIFSHRRNKDPQEFTKRPWTQSVGVGFAVTRDIYLYPNFQFAWERWRRNDFNFADKDVRASSTVGLSATINVF